MEQKERVNLEDFYNEELKNSTMRQALKKTWEQGKIPGKITLQEASRDKEDILWNRISISIKMKNKEFVVGPNPALKDLNKKQKSLVDNLISHFNDGPFTTIRHNLRGLHILWHQGQVFLVIQLFKSTQNTHTNLKTLEKWLKYKQPEVVGAYTLTFDSDFLFRFSKDTLTGKMPFRPLFGKETIQAEFEQGRLILHLQADYCESFEAQSKANQKFLEWVRPNENENFVFWKTRSPLWVQLALAANAKTYMHTTHFPTLSNINVLGKKIKTTLRVNSKEQDGHDLLNHIKTNDVNALIVEEDKKVFSRKWFESLGDSSCRKILRVYKDWNTLAEEGRILHKYGWALLKSTAIQTQSNGRHYKIMVLFTNGRVKDLPQQKKVAPAKSGIKFVQK